MNRILSICAFFRHESAALLERKALIRTFGPDPIEEQNQELKRQRKAVLRFPGCKPNAKAVSQFKPRTAPLTMRWELADSASGTKYLRMKWDVTKAGETPAFPHLETGNHEMKGRHRA